MKVRHLIMIILFLFVLAVTAFEVSYALFSSNASNNGNSFTATNSFIPITAPISFGDVVINEINWAGSFNGDDEWVELRNMTSNIINISGWAIDGLGTGANSIVIPSGKLITANGLFLISHFNEATSSSNLNISPDFIATNINLVNSGELLVLKTSTISGTVIDNANGAFPWLEGQVTPPRKSMERNFVPGNGTTIANWHTATTSVNLDPTATESATPKAVND